YRRSARADHARRRRGGRQRRGRGHAPRDRGDEDGERAEGRGPGDGRGGPRAARPGGERRRRPRGDHLMTDTVIEFRDVNKWFGNIHVLRDINLAVEMGEVVVVCGPSGSGKSTLIRCVNALEPIQGGQLVVLGESLTKPGVNLPALRTRVAMVLQSFSM